MEKVGGGIEEESDWSKKGLKRQYSVEVVVVCNSGG